MSPHIEQLIEQLVSEHTLPQEGYEQLIAGADHEVAQILADTAVEIRKRFYGDAVFVRGLIEFSNYCKNDCYYCGLRVSNRTCDRYRLSAEQVAACTDVGYELGFRTFVLQSGEDPKLTDEVVCETVRAIKDRHPDCAVTLSLGERSRESYAALREAGAERYLLRHETATPEHYAKLHPSGMSFEARMERIDWLRELGFAVGLGLMVGSPGQTAAHLAADLKLIEEFQPEMCGIGPFIPHHATPFAHEHAGTLEQTLLMLSLIRIIDPRVLLPATTALGTIDPKGREKGILAGANVVMPNLSPANVRDKYSLYDNKLATGMEAAEGWRALDESMRKIGYHLTVDRGDPALQKKEL